MAEIDKNIFREYDIRGMVGTQLNDEAVAVIGRAAGTFFVRNGARSIALGFDARESSPRFAEILTRTLRASGCGVVSIGMVPTPVLYHAVFTRNVDGGIMITGSHNPADHNGFKLCLGHSALFGDQVREIGRIADSLDFTSGEGGYSEEDEIGAYIADLTSRFGRLSRKLKVVVDAGNGMGGVTAVPLYTAMGAELIELYTEPDAAFPNHHPDPTVTENLEHMIAAVRESGADAGIAFDGDGDRIGVVDETGRIIWGDELMILLSREILAEHPGSAVIAEVKCSQNLFDDIEKNGGVAIMERAGHSIIKSRMKESGAMLAGEMSGHIFFADQYYGFDDATYAGARLLEILSRMDKPLSQLFEGIPKTYSTPELRADCPDDLKFKVVSKVAEHFAARHKVITIDGARILFDHGWGLVRASNTQAILVLRFEADSPESLEAIRREVEGVVDECVANASDIS